MDGKGWMTGWGRALSDRLVEGKIKALYFVELLRRQYTSDFND